MEHKEVEERVHQALKDYLPVLGLAHWRIDVEVVGPAELLMKAHELGLYPPGDIYAMVHPTPGLAKTFLIVSDSGPYDQPGGHNVDDVVLHELGHLVASERSLQEEDAREELFCDWIAAVVGRARSQFEKLERPSDTVITECSEVPAAGETPLVAASTPVNGQGG